MTTETKPDYWPIPLSRSSNKRLSPFAPESDINISNISAEDFRNHKLPKVSHDAESVSISGFVPVEGYRDTCQGADLLHRGVGSTASGDSSPDCQNHEDENLLDVNAESNASGKEVNDICCFGMVCEK